MAKRRNYYSNAEKRRFLAEAEEPGKTPSSVALQHKFHPGYLSRWKKALEKGLLENDNHEAAHDSAPRDPSGDNHVAELERIIVRQQVTIERLEAQLDKAKR